MLPAKRSAKFITSRCTAPGSALRHWDDAPKAVACPDASFEACLEDSPLAAHPASARPIDTVSRWTGRRSMAFQDVLLRHCTTGGRQRALKCALRRC
jgi:hypothetical protein